MIFKKCLLAGSILLQTFNYCAAQQLPIWNDKQQLPAAADWLVAPVNSKAEMWRSNDGKQIILYNGLLKRTFTITPNLACIDFTNVKTGQQLVRAIKEEARIAINGKKYFVGGLNGQQEKAYLLPEWVDQLTAGKEDFKYINYEVSPIKPQLKWKSNFWMLNAKGGSGKMISFLFRSDANLLKGVDVRVNYELFDGMPLLVKSMEIKNNGSEVLQLDSVVNEVLGMVEEESAVDGTFEKMKKPQGVYFETNYAFNNSMQYRLSDQTTHWKTDTTYTSQVNPKFQTPVVLEIYADKAPGIALKPGETFNSVRTHEMLMDSYDRERRGLAVRKMYQAVAPWTAANPIFMHLVSRTDEEVRTAIDQCAATGYEALILSFGSHLHMENIEEKYLAKWKAIADYAHRKKVRIGSYSLFSSRSINPENDVINPKTGKPGGAFFGNAPCFGSEWGLWYSGAIKTFFTETGFDIWENDGPYPGDQCASTTHPGHKGLEDSQWRQMEIQKDLYHWLNRRGIYINAPDWYFLDGTNKIALGYREGNFKLPRAQQKILNRQNIYDATWEKTPSMSWGFVPLIEYGGGGPEATLEPLSDHLNDYEQLMMQYYGAGIQACYRGPRLYDTEKTKGLVIKVIDWYKKYREILNSDIFHLRRADGRDWDGILHVNPGLKTKGLVMVYNPTKKSITRTINLPLYYTGLTTSATVREKEGKPRVYQLKRDYNIPFTFTIAAESYNWFTIE